MPEKRNPFTLTFGKQPNRLVLRREMTEQIVDDFLAENPVSQVYLIEGIRGSGKTVLMTTVAKQLESEGWIIINLNSTMISRDGIKKPGLEWLFYDYKDRQGSVNLVIDAFKAYKKTSGD